MAAYEFLKSNGAIRLNRVYESHKRSVTDLLST